jgi:hypothetical protein
MGSTLKLWWRGLLRWPLFRRLAVALPLLGLALWVIAADLSADRAWPVAAFLLIGLLVLVVPTEAWQRFLSRIENAQIGPLGLGLRQEVEKAAEIAPPSDKGEGVEREAEKEAQTIFDLRMQLEWRLTFIAKHLLGTVDRVTFVTIGSLLFDGYLTKAEARTAAGIMMAREEEFKQLPEAERQKFLADAQTFLDGLRAAVFWGRVKRELQDKGDAGEDGLFLERVRGTGGRNDLLAKDGAGEEIRVIPILAINPGSKKLSKAIEPIEADELPRPKTRRQIIVVPDTSETELPPHSPAQIVTLGRLREALQSP